MVGPSAQLRAAAQRTLWHVSLVCPIAPGSCEGLGGQDYQGHSAFLPALAVRTSVTSRYEMVYRSTTAPEAAALGAGTARGTGRRDCGGRGCSMGGGPGSSV